MQKLQHKNKLLKTISVKTYTLIKKNNIVNKKSCVSFICI